MDFTLDHYAQQRAKDGRIYVAFHAEFGIKPGHTHDSSPALDLRQAQYNFQEPGTWILAHFLGSFEEEQAIHNRLYADTSGRPGSERKKRNNNRGDLSRGEEWWLPTGVVVKYVLQLLDRHDITYIGGWNYNLVHTVLHTATEDHIRRAVDNTWAKRVRSIRSGTTDG